MSALVDEEPPELIDSDEEEEAPKKAAAATAAPEVEEDTTLANSDVTTKYQEAAKIVNLALAEVASLCVAGGRILDICTAGDNFINARASAIFRGKSKSGKVIERGIAFPVCVSVNECVCHCSPLVSEDAFPPLAEGDIVKIDLGVHIDGYIAVGAHTVIVGHIPNPEAPVTGSRADCVVAAWTAAEIAVKLLKAGNNNVQVTDAMKQVAETFGVRAISGTVMHQMKRYVIDGNKIVMLREEPEQRPEACTFEQYEVYAIDVAFSSGEGRSRDTGARTTVFKRRVDVKYGLKVKASRLFFNEVNKRFPTLPFTLRALPDETNAKMGVRECVAHELVVPYPVLYERPGDQIAHCKFTVLLLASGTVKITGLEMPAGFASPEKLAALPEELKALLASDEGKRKKKKRSGGGKKKGGGAAAADEDEDA